MKDVTYDEHVEIENQKFQNYKNQRCNSFTSWLVSLVATLFIFSIIGAFMLAVFVSLN